MENTNNDQNKITPVYSCSSERKNSYQIYMIENASYFRTYTVGKGPSVKYVSTVKRGGGRVKNLGKSDDS